MSDRFSDSPVELPPPPSSLIRGASLFLDFDGTLVALAATPGGIVVDPGLVPLLRRLRDGLNGRLAIVSGRSIATLRDLGMGEFLLAGTHGLEFASPAGQVISPVRSPAIDQIQAAFDAFAQDKPGVLVERKSISVGLHFRGAPEWSDAAFALASTLADRLGLTLQSGKMLYEVRPGGADKGSAVRSLMTQAPMAGGLPIFIGDDLTDEEGFAAAIALGGTGILVGPTRQTHAAFRLEQDAAVRHYLREAVASFA